MPTVRTTNPTGGVAEVQVDDDMVETLKGRVRNGDLESVEVIADDAPDLVNVPVQYRPRPAVVLLAEDGEPSEPAVLIDERRTHPGQVVPEDSDSNLDALRAEYEAEFGEAPHRNKKAETLRKEIDAKRSGD